MYEDAAVSRPKPVLLLILDGWGHREDAPDNAIACARAPNWRRLLSEYPVAGSTFPLIHRIGYAHMFRFGNPPFYEPKREDSIVAIAER